AILVTIAANPSRTVSSLCALFRERLLQPSSAFRTFSFPRRLSYFLLNGDKPGLIDSGPRADPVQREQPTEIVERRPLFHPARYTTFPTERKLQRNLEQSRSLCQSRVPLSENQRLGGIFALF